jgi:hypothetical protein
VFRMWSVQGVGGRLDEDVQQLRSGCGYAVLRVNEFRMCRYPGGVQAEAGCELLEVQAACLETDDICDSRKFVSNTRLSGDRV